MASEPLVVCQALAAMLRSHGEPSAEEVTFVGHAAFDLALTAEEIALVQETLRAGGDYAELISQVTSKPMRTFLFRRVVAAALLDEQINEQEQAFIDRTATAFGYDGDTVAAFTGWIKDGIAWEKRGAQLMAQL